MRILLVSLLVLVGSSFAVVVEAQSNNDTLARSFFESGRAYYDRAEYDEAARAFAEAYRLSHRPALLLNQARALDEGDRTEEAIAILEQAEREIPASEVALRDEVHQRLVRLRLELERTRARQAAEAAQAAANPGTPATSAAEPADEGPNTAVVVGLVSGGTGIAMLATALGTGIAASHVQDRLDANCPGTVCPASFAGDIDHGHRLARTSTAMTFLGVGAIGAAIPLVIHGLRHGRETEPRVQVTSGPGRFGGGLRVRF